MKLVVDIPNRILGQVREVVKQGDYDNSNEFILAALESQIALETSSGDNRDGIPTIDEYLSGDSNLSENDQIPDGYSPLDSDLTLHDFSGVSICDLPSPGRIEDGPLWGQYNRIFPVKLVVRQLANELKKVDADQVPLKSFQEDVASKARALGLRVKQLDNEAERRRGEKLSSGLPVGSEAGKSMRRFKDQFVGRVNQDGSLSGAAPALHFVDITPGKNNKIGLTKFGVEFAGLRNTLLDESLQSDVSLSDAERVFYIEHVVEHLPDEFQAMRKVIDSIRSGHDRPEELTKRVAQLNGKWSDAQASTMRTGLVSRMFELGLLSRERVGKRGVAYQLTGKAGEFPVKSRGESA